MGKQVMEVNGKKRLQNVNTIKFLFNYHFQLLFYIILYDINNY